MSAPPFRFGVVAATARSGQEWLARARRVEALGDATLLVPDRLGPLLSPLPALAAAAGCDELGDPRPQGRAPVAGDADQRVGRPHQRAGVDAGDGDRGGHRDHAAVPALGRADASRPAPSTAATCAW
jgi:hypothetical protein